MVWSITDRVIEDRAECERQFHDIRGHGFGGVAVFVRCSRYRWDQKPARLALAHIARLCREHEMQFWAGPDARFISRELIGDTGGLRVLLYGDRVKATRVPNLAPVVDGRFNLRCQLGPRQTHMLHEVAIDYAPVGLVQVFAAPAEETVPVSPGVIDLSGSAHFFYNARERYVEVFGEFEPPDGRDWQVLAFFHVRSSHVDFSDDGQMRRYGEKLIKLGEAVDALDGFMWDEPGFTCVYGALPYSGAIEKRFRKRTGLVLHQQLWKLALACDDNSHLTVRIGYFRSVQEVMLRAQRRVHKQIAKIWAPAPLRGIHDTWHFESGDMCDMNHGSLDLWRSLAERSGGFVDLGGIQALAQPGSDYYANLAAMAVIGASLARHSSGQFAYNNLWTIDDDDGDGSQAGAMGHCVDTMALFGQRWLAHCYGPAGTIGEEERFLGSPPLPGYPKHSTWQHFPRWNERLRTHHAAIGDRLPWANLLLLFPVKSLFALADARADAVAANLFRLLLTLLDQHYHVDVVSPALLVDGRWRDGHFEIGRQRYDAIIVPHATVLPRKAAKLLAQGHEQTLYAFVRPQYNERGEPLNLPVAHFAGGEAELVAWLAARPALRPVHAPADCWLSLFRGEREVLVALAPARYGYAFAGELSYNGSSFSLPMEDDLCLVRFPEGGVPELLELPLASKGE